MKKTEKRRDGEKYQKQKRTLSPRHDKTTWKAGTMLYPLPVVLVGCGSLVEESINLITVAWTGIINTDPPMCSISIRPERYSYELIMKYRDFSLNLTTSRLAYATDWCGIKSGREVDKFSSMKLTPLKADLVHAPLVAESPVNLECRFKDKIELGSHHLLLAEILSVHASQEYLDPRTGRFALEKSNPICYSHGCYYHVGKKIGKFGFSVRRKKRSEPKKKPGMVNTPD